MSGLDRLKIEKNLCLGVFILAEVKLRIKKEIITNCRKHKKEQKFTFLRIYAIAGLIIMLG